ncbi:MAG: glycosyltransferase [Pseudoxanthomonas sp.]
MAPARPERLRVLHIGKFYAPQRGGIERHVQDLAEWQVQRDIDSQVLVHQAPGHWRSERDRINGVSIERVGCIAAPLYAPISPTFPWRLAAMIRRQRPQLLHLHLPNPSCFALLASPAARRLPWVVHWHADISPDAQDWRLHVAYRLYRPFEQAVLRRAAAIIVTSQAYRDASVALKPWLSKTTVVPLGIGPMTGSSAPASAEGESPWPAGDGLKLLAVGRLSYYKGFDTLLDALALLRDRGDVPVPRLLLIGDGEHGPRLREHARRLNLSDTIVRFAGGVDNDVLQTAYASADLFVLPSLDRSEAFGLVLLEAMRAGLPVVASAIAGSGVGHVVTDSVNGDLVTPGDAVALADALARMTRESARRQRMGAAGLTRWREEFSLEHSAREVRDVYENVLD